MRIARFVLLIALLLSAGCQSLDLSESMQQLPWSSKKSQYGRPTKLIAFWSDAFSTPAGGTATRGFGGRFYFYDDRSQPIAVDGELVVYAYDESQAPAPGQEKKLQADRRFVFTSEKFTHHFSATDLGASYSFWLPWDRINGPRREITLVPVFTSSEGHRVVGQQTKITLPGKPAESDTRRVAFRKQTNVLRPRDNRSQAVQPLGHQVAGEPRRDNLKTTTIQVPQSISRRLAANLTPQKKATLTPRAPISTAGMSVPGYPQQQAPNQHLQHSAPLNSGPQVPWQGSQGPSGPGVLPASGNSTPGSQWPTAPHGQPQAGAVRPVGYQYAGQMTRSTPFPANSGQNPYAGQQRNQGRVDGDGNVIYDSLSGGAAPGSIPVQGQPTAGTNVAGEQFPTRAEQMRQPHLIRSARPRPQAPRGPIGPQDRGHGPLPPAPVR